MRRLSAVVAVPLSLWLAFLFLLSMPCASARAAVIRVDAASVATAPDGASWALAHPRLTPALLAARPGDEVWVAAGVYQESNLRLPAGVGLYGGFAGTETIRTDRDSAAHETIIESAAAGLTTSGPGLTVVDGFQMRLKGGAAATYGWVMACYDSDVVVRNNVITGFYWNRFHAVRAALLVRGGAPVFQGNVFRMNRAPRGGAVYIEASNARILNNAFVGNAATAPNGEGGAVYCSGGQPVITGNTFHGNAARSGGALFLSQTNGTVTGNTFAANLSPKGAIHAVGGANHLANNIIAENTSGLSADATAALTLSANCVFGNPDGDFLGMADPTGANGNLSVDPLLSDGRLGDLHIQPGSPCRDAGDPAAPEQLDVDQDGQPRVQGGTVDIGADESDGTLWPDLPSRIVRVHPDGNDAADGATWQSAMRTIQAAADAAGAGGEVWVAEGAYAKVTTVTGSTSLFGGFSGREMQRTQRDPVAHPTVLSGPGRAAVRIAGPHTGTVDGFTVIRGGYALGADKAMGYGGIVCDGSAPVVSNNVFTDPVAVGVDVLSGARPLIEDNAFPGAAGAANVTCSTATVRRNTINACNDGISLREGSHGLVLNNSITAARNTAILADGTSTATVANNLFAHNETGVWLNGSGRVVNNTFVSTASFDVLVRTADAVVANNIFYLPNTAIRAESGVATTRRNCFYGGVAYAGIAYPAGQDPNIFANPRLASVPDGNYHIQPDSPCRDAGDDSVVDPSWTDMDGQPRLQGAHVDIGADESDGTEHLPYVVRVRPDGDDTLKGDTWATAKRTVAAAAAEVAIAQGGEVWVAAGTYTHSLSLGGDTELYGGFAGTETARGQRDPARNVSMIQALASQNAIVQSIVGSFVLDGFTVRGASTGITVSRGAPVIRNCVITGNKTGISCRTGSAPVIVGNRIERNTNTGIASSSASPVIADNTIRDNRGFVLNNVSLGGGVYVSQGAPVITGNLFIGNRVPTETGSSTLHSGGALHLASSAARVDANVFRGNTAARGGAVSVVGGPPIALRNNLFIANTAIYGGALFTDAANVSLENNTIIANTAFARYGMVEQGGAVYAANGSQMALTNNIVAFNSSGLYRYTGAGQPASSIVLRNNCLYGNRAYDVSGLDDPTGLNGNIKADPMFADLPRGDWHIRPDSPCRNAGANDVVPDGSLDLDGQPRIQDGTVDIGADESDGTIPSAEPAIIRVRPDGDDANDGSTWALAKRTVQAAVDALFLGGEVWVAGGTYPGLVTLSPFTFMYGGFRGDETTRSARDWRANPTILDAQRKGVVVAAQGVYHGAVDGFTIQNGVAHNPFYTVMGAGGLDAYSGAVTVANNLFRRNEGYMGGAVSMGGPGDVHNNVFAENTAGSGGGIYVTPRAGARVANNLFHDNSARSGAAIYMGSGAGAAVNNTIVYNGAADNAAAVHVGYFPTSPPGGPVAPVLLANNIVAGNAAGFSVETDEVATFRANCVFDNTGPDYRGIDDPTGTDGNIKADPRFAMTPPGFWHIQPDSPCRDAGDDAAVLSGDRDMDGQVRIQNGRVDIGADESDGTTWVFAPRTVRVHPNGNDANDGSTWALAMRTVQAGVDAVTQTGGEVWVAAAVYHEAITLAPYVGLYGGFTGTEVERAARIPSSYRAVLDAPARSVAVSVPLGAMSAVVDGFTIRHGNVPASVAAFEIGGAIICEARSSAVLANNIILGHSGGRGTILATRAEVTLERNVIAGNRVAPGGPSSNNGIVYADRCQLTMRNNLMSGNEGAAVSLVQSAATLAGNTIVANSAEGIVWGLTPTSTDPVLVNNIIAYNGTGLSRKSGVTPVTTLRANCLWGNLNGNVAGLDDPTGTDGNITADPRFASLAYGDFHIQADSPCRNTGDSALVAPAGEDMDGQPRVQEGRVDIGADESDGSSRSVPPRIVRVRPDGDDVHDGSSWLKAKRSVRVAMLDLALRGGEAWVASGLYPERVTVSPFASVYGGFRGTEVSREARDLATPATVLDGGAGGTVLSVPFGLRSLTVDRLTIRNGYRETGSSAPGPGGIRAEAASIVLSHCTIEDNDGSAAGLGPDSVALSNLVTRNTTGLSVGPRSRVEGNVISFNQGYGVSAQDGALILGNTVEDNRGGGISVLDDTWVLYNAIRRNFGYNSQAGGITAGGTGTVIAGNEVTGNGGSDAGGVFGVGNTLVTGNRIAHNTNSGVYAGDIATIEGNSIIGNFGGYGAGIRVKTGRPVIRGNVIVGNHATGSEGGYGGGLHLGASNAIVVNNTIAGNTAYVAAGGLLSDGGAPTIANNIIAFGSSGVLLKAGAPGFFRNNCVFGNEGGNFEGTVDLTNVDGNISLDPQLAALSYGDVHIQPDSPCRDAGDSALVPPGATDMDGEPRIQGARVDIGADESDGLPRIVTPRIVYVRPDGDNGQDGGSWSSAKATVQAGIDAVSETGGDVWVAAGTYSGHVQLAPYVHLYGGFRGDETLRDTRRPSSNRTILDGGGELGYVITAETTGASGAIDGFVIRGGAEKIRGDGSVEIGGGGISCRRSSPAIRNNEIADNNGSGILLDGSAPLIADNLITRNTAHGSGGGLSSYRHSSPALLRNIFRDNHATNTRYGSMGGAVYMEGSKGRIADNLVTGNSAARGGGLWLQYMRGTVANNTITDNTASDQGGGAYLMPTTTGLPRLLNNIIAFNSSGLFLYQTEGGSALEQNNLYFGNTAYNRVGLPPAPGSTASIVTNPLFADRASGNYRLTSGSPAVDAGTDDAVTPGDRDLDGRPRILGARVDIGAYEFGQAAFNWADVLRALEIAGGLRAAVAEDARLDLNPAPDPGIDVRDAAGLARKAAGLDANP